MEIKDIIGLLISGMAAIIALISIIKALIEYKKQGTVKRAELLLSMRDKFRSNDILLDICNMLESDDEELRKLDLVHKEMFLCFFEEIALLYNSKLINTRSALYLFGHHVILCLNSNNFWRDVNISHVIVEPFKGFARQMQEAEKNANYSEKSFRL